MGKGKTFFTGSVKATLFCTHCDFSITATPTEGEKKIKRHTRVKHNVVYLPDITIQVPEMSSLGQIYSNR